MYHLCNDSRGPKTNGTLTYSYFWCHVTRVFKQSWCPLPMPDWCWHPCLARGWAVITSAFHHLRFSYGIRTGFLLTLKFWICVTHIAVYWQLLWPVQLAGQLHDWRWLIDWDLTWENRESRDWPFFFFFLCFIIVINEWLKRTWCHEATKLLLIKPV